jgi:hypothetical protein
MCSQFIYFHSKFFKNVHLFPNKWVSVLQTSWRHAFINSKFVIDGKLAEAVDDLYLLLWFGGGLVGDKIAEFDEDSCLLLLSADFFFWSFSFFPFSHSGLPSLVCQYIVTLSPFLPIFSSSMSSRSLWIVHFLFSLPFFFPLVVFHKKIWMCGNRGTRLLMPGCMLMLSLWFIYHFCCTGSFFSATGVEVFWLCWSCCLAASSFWVCSHLIISCHIG